MVRTNLPYKFRNEGEKKVFGAKSQAHSSRSIFFLPGTKVLLTLSGAEAVFCGGTGPEMHFSGTGPVTFFWGTTVTGGHTSRLVGTISNGPIWGAHPRNALPLCRACSSVCPQLISKLCQGVLRFVLFY